MATHKSSEKRARGSAKKNQRNSQYISAVRTSVKKLRLAIAENKDAETLQGLYKAAQSILAKAASKGILHKNNAGRRIGRLAHALRNAAAPNTAAPKAATKKKAPAAAKAAAPKKAAPAAKKKPATAAKKKK